MSSTKMPNLNQKSKKINFCDILNSKSTAIFRVLATTCISQLLSLVGIISNKIPLKILSVIFLLISIIYCLYAITKFTQSSIYSTKIISLIVISIMYPWARIVPHIFVSNDFKDITDLLVVNGSIYLTPLAGIAISGIMGRKSLEKSLLRYGLVFSPLICIPIILGNHLVERSVFILIMDQILIPVSLLALLPRCSRFATIIGYISCALLFLYSTLAWTRSYSIVAVFITVAIIFAHPPKSILRFVFVILCIIMMGFFSKMALNMSHDFDQSGESKKLEEKFQLDSLSVASKNFLKSGDIMEFWNWDGNSRKDIVSDAFGDFTPEEWLFGRGVKGTYLSFVERTTIEIGWLQETFLWGLLYVLPLFSLIAISIYRIFFNCPLSLHNIQIVLVSLIVIRWLDGWIYGMPGFHVYNVLFFAAIAKGLHESPCYHNYRKYREFQSVYRRRPRVSRKVVGRKLITV